MMITNFMLIQTNIEEMEFFEFAIFKFGHYIQSESELGSHIRIALRISFILIGWFFSSYAITFGIDSMLLIFMTFGRCSNFQAWKLLLRITSNRCEKRKSIMNLSERTWFAR